MVNYIEAQLDTVFSALSDPTRREMIARLTRGDMSVADLAEPFKISKPAVTKHLKKLERAGLIRRHIEGRTHRCELVAEPLSEVSHWLQFYERYWNAKFDQLDAYLSSDDSN